jgi:hypothetical protein
LKYRRKRNSQIHLSIKIFLIVIYLHKFPRKIKVTVLRLQLADPEKSVSFHFDDKNRSFRRNGGMQVQKSSKSDFVICRIKNQMEILFMQRERVFIIFQ